MRIEGETAIDYKKVNIDCCYCEELITNHLKMIILITTLGSTVVVDFIGDFNTVSGLRLEVLQLLF